jgi:hypothetical protein
VPHRALTSKGPTARWGPSTFSGVAATANRPAHRSYRRGTGGVPPVRLGNDPTKLSAADPEGWAPTQPAAGQLVACVTHTGQGEFAKRCEYQPDAGDFGDASPAGRQHPFSAGLHKGNYTVTVYEARSGKPLGGADVRETTSGRTFRTAPRPSRAGPVASPRHRAAHDEGGPAPDRPAPRGPGAVRARAGRRGSPPAARRR